MHKMKSIEIRRDMKKIFISFIISMTLAVYASAQSGSGTIGDPYYGTISTSVIWNLTNFPGGVIYVGKTGVPASTYNDITVITGGHLTIGPGIIVTFLVTTSDLIITGGGLLTANGTSSQQVTFTKGFSISHWGHISFETPGSPNPIAGSGSLDQCIVEYGYAATSGTNPDNAGGGIQVNANNVIISNCLFRHNYSNFGGAITVNAGRNTRIRTCRFQTNSANECGGAMLLWTSSTAVVENCVFDQNYCKGASFSAYSGGAIWLLSTTSTIVNCTFAKNTSDRAGDAVYSYNSPGSRIINSIFWGSNDQYANYGTAGVIYNCAFETTKPSSAVNSIIINSNNSAANGPNFMATDGSDWSIKFISPCRDSGTIPNPPVATDFVGNSRIGPYDIGAYENQYTKWKTTATSSDWATAGNWENGVPTSSSDVLIPTGATNYPTGSSSQNYTLGVGKYMILAPGAQAALGTLTNNGFLKLESDATGISSLICNSYSGNDAEVQLYLKGGTGTIGPNWHYISSPFTSLSVSAISSITMDLAQWVESLATANLLIGWVAYDGFVYRHDVNPPYSGPIFTSLAPGKGYNHYFASDYLYTLKGQLNSSDVVANLGYTVVSPDQPAIYGLNLLGNPFSSGLNWDLIANDPGFPANTSRFIYFNKGGTIVYYVNGVGSEPGVTGIIPPMQGFFTKTNTTGNSIRLSASARVNGSIPARYKKGETIIPLVRINLSSGTYNDYTVVRFDNSAKSGMDYEFDAPKLFLSNAYPYIYSVSEGASFAINGQPFPDSTIVIPFIVNLPSTGNFSLSAIQLQGLDNYKVTLIDKTTGFETNLKTTPVLSFSASAGLITDRFVLKVSDISTGIEKPISSTGIFNIYPSAGYINIQTVAENWDGKTGTIRVMDLTGKVVCISDNAYFSINSLITVPERLAGGIYFVEIRSGSVRYVGKIVIR
jgi:hypothetical protein